MPSEPSTPIALTNVRIYTVDPSFTVHNPGCVVFDSEAILAVGPASDVVIPENARVIDGHNRLAVMPGLIDAHSHSSLLKGFSENAQLMDWLPEYQREHQVLTDEDAYYACLVSYMEAVKGGTTLVADMYRKLHEAARAATDIGMRADLIPYAADNPDKTFFETLETTRQLIEQVQTAGDTRVTPWIGLEHITYCSGDMYREAAAMSAAYKVNIHTHTSEQREEVDAVVELFGRRPVEQFHEYGILKPGTVLAHCVWLNDSEIQLLGASGTGVAHCPISNMKLASGPAPLASFADYGITVGLGSDGGISNNSLSMFECMKTGSLLQKVNRLDATAVSARQAMEMATINGARLLGHADIIGSIEPGKQADLIAIDLWQPHLMPVIDDEAHDPVLWNLVFAGRASDVTDVWVNGEHIVEQGRLLKLDEDACLQQIHQQTSDLLTRRRDAKAIPMI